MWPGLCPLLTVDLLLQEHAFPLQTLALQAQHVKELCL